MSAQSIYVNPGYTVSITSRRCFHHNKCCLCDADTMTSLSNNTVNQMSHQKWSAKADSDDSYGAKDLMMIQTFYVSVVYHCKHFWYYSFHLEAKFICSYCMHLLPVEAINLANNLNIYVCFRTCVSRNTIAVWHFHTSKGSEATPNAVIY